MKEIDRLLISAGFHQGKGKQLAINLQCTYCVFTLWGRYRFVYSMKLVSAPSLLSVRLFTFRPCDASFKSFHLIQINVMARYFNANIRLQTCLVPKVEQEILILIYHGTLPNAIYKLHSNSPGKELRQVPDKENITGKRKGIIAILFHVRHYECLSWRNVYGAKEE